MSDNVFGKSIVSAANELEDMYAKLENATTSVNSSSSLSFRFVAESNHLSINEHSVKIHDGSVECTSCDESVDLYDDEECEKLSPRAIRKCKLVGVAHFTDTDCS